MKNNPERDLNPPEEAIIPEVEFIRDYTTVDQVNHNFPLATRIRSVLLAFVDDEFDVDIAIEVLKECEAVILKADENFKSIASLTNGLDAAIEHLKDTIKVQA